MDWRTLGHRARRLAPKIGSALAIALVAGLLAVSLIVPRLMNGAALTVLTGSMRPTYPPGSLVVVRPVEPENVRVADVITFQEPGASSFTTHRVVEIGTDDLGRREFVTKGDGNETPDIRPVAADSVRGEVVFGLPIVGSLRDWAASPLGLGAVALTLTAAVVWDRLRPSKDRPRTRERQVADGELIPVAPALVHEPGDEPLGQQLLLARLNVNEATRRAVLDLLPLLPAQIVAFSETDLVLAVTGTVERLDTVTAILGRFGALEYRRSSVVDLGAADAPQAVESLLSLA